MTFVRDVRPCRTRVPAHAGHAGQGKRREAEQLSWKPKLPEARQKRCHPPVDAAITVLEEAVPADRCFAGCSERTELRGEGSSPGECETATAIRAAQIGLVYCRARPTELITAIHESHTLGAEEFRIARAASARANVSPPR